MHLGPADLNILGAADSRVGPISVLLISTRVDFNQTSRTLSFEPSAVRLLNRGTTEDAIIVESAAEHLPPLSTIASGGGRFATGDTRFLRDLPAKLSDFGTSLLRAVRAEFPGELRYFEPSGKFVETPDNFWTVRIQKRDESFRITIRGRPDHFVRSSVLELKPDMTGYSSLKVSSPEQIKEFVKMLRQVVKKDRRK